MPSGLRWISLSSLWESESHYCLSLILNESHTVSVCWQATKTNRKKLIRLVTLPNPDQGICKSLLINPPVAMAGRTAKYKTIIIPFCFKRCCRALVGHHPIMMGQFRTFCAIVVFRYMSKNAQWFSNTVFNQLFSRVVLPCPELIYWFLWCIIIFCPSGTSLQQDQCDCCE